MTERDSQRSKRRFSARVVQYLRHHRRATRVELLLLVLVFLFFEFVIPTVLSSRYSKAFFEKHLSDALKYQVNFERINTHLFGRPMMQVAGFTIRDHQGIPFFKADDVVMQLSSLALLRGRVVLDRIRVTDGDFLAARLPDGRWNVADLVGAGNDPDHAIDLERTAIDMRNVVVTFHDQALSLPLMQRIRLRDFYISSLDIRRKTSLRVDAIDEEHPQSNFEMNGNFALFIPGDISTLSGHIDLALHHFNLGIVAPYLRAFTYPVKDWRGFYDLDLKMDGKGAAPLPVSFRSRVEELKVAVTSQKASGGVKVPARAPNPAANEEWIDLGSASLAGPLKISSDQIQSDQLQGMLAGNHFEAEGRIYNLQNGRARLAVAIKTKDFDLVEPARSLIRVSLDDVSRRIFSGITGMARADLKWSGKPDDLILEWKAELKRGTYRDARYQLALKDLSSVLRSDGKKTRVESLQARLFDSPLSASGWIDENDQLDLDLSIPALPLGQLVSLLKTLRAQRELNLAPWLDRVPAAAGQLQARLHMTGTADQPGLTGKVTWQRGRLQLAGVFAPLQNIKGQIQLDPDFIYARQFSGSLGDSPFSLDATIVRANGTVRDMNFHADSFNLSRYDELAKGRWIDPVRLPVLGELREADGRASVQLTYHQGTPAVNGDMEIASLPEFSVEAQHVNGTFSNLSLPLHGLSGSISYDTHHLRFEHVRGDMGDSSISIEGAVEDFKRPEEKWKLKIDGEATFPQVAAAIPADWKNQFSARGRFPIHASLEGTCQEGIQVVAGIQLPQQSEFILAKRVHKGGDASSRLEVTGLWKEHTFTLTQGRLDLGDVPLVLSGSLGFPSNEEARMNLNVTLNQFTPMASLMKFVETPIHLLNIKSGMVSGSVAVKGGLAHPQWNSSLRVADVSVGGMPWGMTSLTGDLTAGQEGISAKDFLAIVNNVPMRITGRMDWGGPYPDLNFDVKNLNLDALVATIARMSAVAEPVVSAGRSSGQTMNIEITSSGGIFFHQPIRKFSARGFWDGDILHISPMEVITERGTSTGHIAWNSRTNEQHMEFEAHEVPMGPFLDEVLDLQLPVDAKLNVVANLTAQNPTPDNLLSSFSGTVHFDASNGTLANAGLPQRLLSMAALVHEGLFGFNLGRIFQTIDPPRFKTFKRFSADVSFFSNGTARLENGSFESDLFNLNATGPINTKTEEMNIDVRGSMPEIPRGSNFLAQIFGRISIRDLYRNLRDFGMLLSGQGKKIKPRRHYFEFKLTGNLEGIKSIEDFHFTH